MEKRNVKFYVDKFIDRNPFIKEGIYEWYINSTGLALIIHPYIKSKLWDDVSFDAVKMSLFRAGKNIKMPEKIDLFRTKEIFIKKWINILSTDLDNNIRKKVEKVNWKYYVLIWWEKQKIFIFDDYYKDKIKTEDINWEILSDLIIVWIKLDNSLYNIQNHKWVFYLISKKLYFHW